MWTLEQNVSTKSQKVAGVQVVLVKKTNARLNSNLRKKMKKQKRRCINRDSLRRHNQIAFRVRTLPDNSDTRSPIP